MYGFIWFDIRVITFYTLHFIYYNSRLNLGHV